jgi:hypothetical protein
MRTILCFVCCFAPGAVRCLGDSSWRGGAVIPQFVFEKCSAIHPVGSRITCNPPIMDTDQDYLVLFKDGKTTDGVATALLIAGWHFDGSRVERADSSLNESQFCSLSLAGVNLIFTSSAVFFGRFLAASSVAKRLNLLDKADRIALFQAVLYGNGCDETTFPKHNSVLPDFVA